MFALPLDHPDSSFIEKEGAQIMFLDHRPDLAVITALVLSITFILLFVISMFSKTSTMLFLLPMI